MPLIFLFLFLSVFSVWGDDLTLDPPQIWPTECRPCRPVEPLLCLPLSDIPGDELIVDLLNPLYEDGVLTTTQGGVLTAPGLRVQAQQITYVRDLEHEPPLFSVACSDQLLIEYQDWVLVGDALEYDFLNQCGSLLNGRTGAPPWYIGGREILLQENGCLLVLDGFITTSEGEHKDIAIQAARIILSPDRVITADHVHVRVKNIPLVWLPTLQLDLKNIGRSPFAVQYGWGGFLGSYVSLLYRFLSFKEFTATARLDGFFGKGLGGGIETVYNPSWRPTQFYTRNYYAHDIPLDNPQRRDRYRFQGTYYDRIGGVTIDGMYDVVSDAQMAADYQTKDFDLKTAGRTQIEFRRQENSWIANLFTRVRVTDFQSVNQELPSFQFHLHPFEIPHTGVIVENTFKASYLDYVFSDDVVNAVDFASSRVSAHPFVYRPFFFGPFIATPEAGFIGIAYSNTPNEGGSAGDALGEFGVKLETSLTKYSGWWKHTIEPYLHYRFLTSPSVPVDNHYIFTIQDGWDRLNLLRFGVRNTIFVKTLCGECERPIWVDIWAHAFFDTPTIATSIQKGYCNIEWQPFSRMLFSIESAWNFQERELDFYNGRIDWTLSNNLALGIEYRHRSRYDWRKADFYNFILESVRTQQQLLASPLSDRRDTLLFRIFSRLTPDWTARFDLRHGWHRENQRPYTEYQIELAAILLQHWKLTFTYDKREADNRYSVSFLLEPGPPPKAKACYR